MAPKDERDEKMERMESILSQLVTVVAASAGGKDDLTLKLTEMLERVTGSQTQTAELITQAQRAQTRPSNNVSPNISPFNPVGDLVEGWVKPKLVCEMHCPHKVEDEMSTIEEVQLLNLLVQAGTNSYIVTRNDDSKIKIQVVVDVDDSGKPSRMVWKHDTGFRNEYARTMRSMVVTMRQMLSQAPPQIGKHAHLVLTMDEWAELVKLGGELPKVA